MSVNSFNRFEDEHLVAEKDNFFKPQTQSPLRMITWLGRLSLVFIGVFIGTMATRHIDQRHKTTPVYIQTISERSPITPDVKLEFHEQRFNGSLLKENIYRQPAGEEVDLAWKALGIDYRSVVIPAELAKKAGLEEDQVKVNSKYGGGYLANVEGLHQLHCLNLLRQGLWFNFGYYHSKGEGPFVNSDYVLQKHVTHCLDIIRQQLMCSVDIGVLGQVWWQSSKMEHAEAYVDFNTHHVCRNFDDIRTWASSHQVPANAPEDYLEPPKPGDKIYHRLP